MPTRSSRRCAAVTADRGDRGGGDVGARIPAARAALALVVSLLAPWGARAQPVEYLPTTHWAYEDLSTLVGRGVIGSLNLASRPWSRVEIARALAAADAPGDPLLARLEREFAKELVWIGRHD